MHSIKGQKHLIIQITYFYCYWAECFTSTFLKDDYPMMHFWRVLIDRWLHWICRPPHWIIMEVRSASPYWHVHTRCVMHFQKGQLFVLILNGVLSRHISASGGIWVLLSVSLSNRLVFHCTLWTHLHLKSYIIQTYIDLNMLFMHKREFIRCSETTH